MQIDILFADADESLRELYQSYLSRESLTIETAGDDLECASKVREFNPHLLIIDLELFDDHAALMRPGSSVFRDVPVIIVTGDERPVRLSEMTSIPAHRCFQKPYSFVALLECMSAALARNTPLPVLSPD